MSAFEPRRLFSFLFVLAIAVVFVLQFGPGSRGCDAPLTPSVSTAAALVNGTEIPLRDFQRAYALRLQAYRSQGELPEAFLQQIAAGTLDEMVSFELLAQAAQASGVGISDDELLEILHKNKEFQKDGAFDFERYEQVLRDYYGKSSADFEAELRRRLAAVRLLEMVESTAVVSEDEVYARFLKDGDTVTLTVVRFLPSMFAPQLKPPSPAEVAAYRAAHGPAVEAFYTENPATYRTEEKVHARHVLVQLPKGASAAAVAEAKARADGYRRDILAGKPFADVARAVSDDASSKAGGGDLGWAERSAFVPEFSQAAFNLKVGEVSEPVRTPFGWHLILVEEKQAAVAKPLADVADEIAAQLLKRERARALAEAAAKKTLAAVEAGKSLTQLHPAKKGGTESFEAATTPEAVDTGSFSVSRSFVPQVGPAPELLAAAAAAETVGPLPSLFPAGEGFVVAEVTARERATPSSFALKKDSVRADALRAKQSVLRTSYLEALKKTGKVVTNQSLVGTAPANQAG
ncbi:MAG: peptidylprolyl isomerase [Myxococcaceae bacterium]